MNKLLVLSGVPGSGKSYFSNTVKKVFGSHVYIVSSDAIRNLICGNQQDLSEEETVWKMFYDLAKVYSSDKKGIVVLDATHYNRKKRLENISKIKQYFDEVDLVSFDIDKNVVMNQNLDREFPIPPEILEEYIKLFEYPNKEDEAFFDKVMVISNRNIASAIEMVQSNTGTVKLIKSEL